MSLSGFGIGIRDSEFSRCSDRITNPGTRIRHEIAGFFFSGSIPRSLMAFSTSLASICLSRASAESAPTATNRASTSKKSRSALRPSLRPNPSVPSAHDRARQPAIDRVGQRLQVIRRRHDHALGLRQALGDVRHAGLLRRVQHVPAIARVAVTIQLAVARHAPHVGGHAECFEQCPRP